jgi:sugar lactone lactonase YvrE
VNVTYTATAAGLQSGTISAWNNNGVLIGQASLSGSGQAPLLNVDPGTVAAIGTTWAAPSAIAVDASGNTYVADAGKIYQTALGGTPSAVASGFSNPSAVVIDGAGDIYVGDSGNNQVVEVPYTNSLYGTPIVLATGLKGTSGLALDGLGNLFIADSGNSRVLLLSRSGNLQAQSLLTAVGSGFTTPVAVAVDNSRNLYVSDAGTNKVVQIAIPTSQQTTILSGLTTAAGVAVDAGGNLYAADTGSGTITRVPNIGGVLNKNYESALGNVVAKPGGIAVDSAGNLYATDAADASVAEVNRSKGLLSFGNVNELDSSASIAANLSNGGTAALTLNSPYYTASGTGAASFAIQNSSTCADGATVNPGADCAVAAIFTPQATGALSETLAFSSNAQDSATLVFSGNGTNLTNSTLVIAITSPTGPPAYGQAVTVGAMLTPNAGGVGTPTGTVTFYLDTVPQTPASTLTSNAASYTFTSLTGGAHVLSASYSGDSNYASAASGNLNLTIGTATTTTSTVTLAASPLWTNPTSVNVGEQVTLSAVVSIAGTGTPTGTVTFMNGAAVLGSGTVTASGLASFATSSLTAGTYSITATYNGDSNFTGSSSLSAVSLLVSPPVITMTSSTLNIVGGGAPVMLTFNSIAGFGLNSGPNTVSLACSGLPQYASCSFTPAFVQFLTGYPTQQATLAVVINQPPPITPSQAGIAGIPHLSGRPGLQALMGLCLLVPGVFLGFKLRRARLAGSAVWRTTAVMLLLLGSCILGATGCGSSVAFFKTPAGASTFTVTATISPTTAAPNPPPTQTLQFNLTVSQ